MNRGPMNDFRVVSRVEPDDRSDGVFWRDGERWLRERGREQRMRDIAPQAEALYLAALTTWRGDQKAREAREARADVNKGGQ